MALYVKFECTTCENDNCYGHSLPTTEKVCDGYKHTTTHADRIRAMSDEELARYIAGQRSKYCAYKDPEKEEFADALNWLKQEANE